MRRGLRLVLAGIPMLSVGLALPALAQEPDQRQGPIQPAAPQEQQPPREPVQEQNPPDAPPSGADTKAAPGAASSGTATGAGAAAVANVKAIAPGTKITVPSGTHIPLVLHNGISTKSTKPGDAVYFETLFPVMIDGKVVIPAGSYVSGEVTESKRPGRVKGRGELMIKLNTMILPNGYMVNLNATPNNADTNGGETVDNEGRIKGDSEKGSDIGTIAKTTAAGAGIGGLATRTPAGAGIGAGVGAAAGLMAVLLTRGPEAEMPRGTTVEVTLNRPVLLDAEKVQFTGPGQASALAGPSNREPVRNKVPF